MYAAKHRLVLDGAADHCAAPLVASPPHAQDGQIVGFGSTRREADLVRVRAKTSRDPLTRLVERRACFAPPPVRARWVAEARAVKRLHGLENLPAYRSGGGVVEIDGSGHNLENIGR